MPHIWTAKERHMVHLIFEEYTDDFDIGARLFNHKYGSGFNGGIDAQKMRYDYIFRHNTGRSAMWKQEIERDSYTQAQEADRADARQYIEDAAQALGINLTPGGQGATTSSNTTTAPSALASASSQVTTAPAATVATAAVSAPNAFSFFSAPADDQVIGTDTNTTTLTQTDGEGGAVEQQRRYPSRIGRTQRGQGDQQEVDETDEARNEKQTVQMAAKKVKGAGKEKKEEDSKAYLNDPKKAPYFYTQMHRREIAQGGSLLDVLDRAAGFEGYRTSPTGYAVHVDGVDDAQPTSAKTWDFAVQHGGQVQGDYGGGQREGGS